VGNADYRSPDEITPANTILKSGALNVFFVLKK
jgi:hypothetical protein